MKTITAPSIKSLLTVRDLSLQSAQNIRLVIKSKLWVTDESAFNAMFPHTAAWISSCYNLPMSQDIRMHAIDEALDNHGVERITARNGQFWDYSNAGDTYDQTVIRHNGRYFVGDWGSIVESKPDNWFA